MTGTKNIRWTAEIVNGQCPTCEELTLLVGLTKSFYRCMTCGADLEQHINGKISYLPVIYHLTELNLLLETGKNNG
jgi:uncharacterized protein (DUF983 family)